MNIVAMLISFLAAIIYMLICKIPGTWAATYSSSSPEVAAEMNAGIDATFSSADKLTIDGDREISLSVDGALDVESHSASVAEGSKLDVEAETVDLAQNAMNVEGEATLTINEGGSFGSNAIVVSGDNASATIQGGK